MRAALLTVAGCLVAIGIAAGQAAKPAAAALPDWSGVWQMVGPTVFDRATVQPQNGRAGDPGVREYPPLTDEYEALYKKNIEKIKAGTFPDPISVCGVPHGFPRIMNVPDVYEFAVTPAATWVLAENGPGVLRVYTDGRSFPAAEELWGTYTGASVGHWEKDTLVVDSVGYNEKFWLSGNGLPSTEALHLVERFTRTDLNTLKYEVTVDDPRTYTKSWIASWTVQWVPDQDIQEYFCEDNAESTFLR